MKQFNKNIILYLLRIGDFFIDNKIFLFMHNIISFCMFFFYKIFYGIVFKHVSFDGKEDHVLFDSEENNTILKIQKLRKNKGMFKNINMVFICDGNRRWAKKHGYTDTTKKVEIGINKIHEIILFLYLQGCKSASFYVFAIRNFRRASDELSAIKKYLKSESIKKYNLKVKIYGEIERFEDKQVVENISKWENNSNSINDETFVINLFLAYNSTECDKDKSNLRAYFDDPVDILVRTSGERRLSDFMVRQVASGTQVKFISPLWPELTISHVFFILLQQKFERIISRII
ncbi:RER2 [Ecytonucleospora hepatopenaei]|uniref:RER2 n=1 Tax=Ecytonucleospora hepatopenaei TaxID=646526 RepID=A0A1W0E8D8_9MICR|nr:RER2 [Ecytonucleospora hepatopenaei]